MQHAGRARVAARGVIGHDDLVTRRFSLDEVADGYAALAAHRITGRAIVELAR